MPGSHINENFIVKTFSCNQDLITNDFDIFYVKLSSIYVEVEFKHVFKARFELNLSLSLCIYFLS
jgi:hypothetical protein